MRAALKYTDELFNGAPPRKPMRWPILCSLILAASALSSQVVQFVVHVDDKTSLAQLFPGAQIDFTWNDIYIVTIWTHDAESMIPVIQTTLDTNKIEVLIPPLYLEAATRRWIEYNILWIGVLIIVFLSGCTCGAAMAYRIASIKRTQGVVRCRTLF